MLNLVVLEWLECNEVELLDDDQQLGAVFIPFR
jgi:hypothetical protein